MKIILTLTDYDRKLIASDIGYQGTASVDEVEEWGLQLISERLRYLEELFGYLLNDDDNSISNVRPEEILP